MATINLEVSVPSEIKDSKGADVSKGIHVHSKLSEKLDDRFTGLRKREPKYKRSESQTQQFCQYKDDIVLEKCAELISNPFGVQLISPIIWKIVYFSNDGLDKNLK